MLYGYQERLVDRISHLLKLRRQQDESSGQGCGRFQCFVPLPFIQLGESNSVGQRINVLDELKTIAISRLMLDNFDYVKAFWPMLGVKPAQVALSFGANDLDGTVQQYQIVHKNRDNAVDSLSVADIRALIVEADRIPVMRDGFYRVITNQ